MTEPTTEPIEDAMNGPITKLTAGPITERGLHAQLQLRRDDFVLNLEIDIAPGQTVAIVGPNGAGKSSVVRALTGLTPLHGGQITLDGRCLDHPDQGVFLEPHERAIGTAFQTNLLFAHMTVGANVGFRIHDRRRRQNLVQAWLDRVGLSGFGDRRVADLSGGEARRVAVARALVGEPSLVILDEPFAGLDVGARAELRRVLIEQMRDHAGARLLITHDPADAQALADQLIVLESGRATQRGTPDEVRRRPATPFVANLVGMNLLRGSAAAGSVSIDDCDLAVTVADLSLDGQVLLTIAPHAVALHRSVPGGSPRNSWSAQVVDLHRVGDVVRVYLDKPAGLVADVTPSAVAELGIAPGRELWVAIKATSFEAQRNSSSA